MDTVKTVLAATLLLFGVAVQANSGDLMVAEATGPFTSSPAEQALTQKAIETLQADEKLKGVITVETHGNTVNLAGTVHSVAMIYRSVEVLRENGVDSVDVNRLESDQRLSKKFGDVRAPMRKKGGHGRPFFDRSR